MTHDFIVEEMEPAIHRPLDCDDYNPVRYTGRVDIEGACRNFDSTKLYCVYCAACVMSANLQGIPYDVRQKCKRQMGWE
jgi:hypothetical protein